MVASQAMAVCQPAQGAAAQRWAQRLAGHFAHVALFVMRDAHAACIGVYGHTPRSGYPRVSLVDPTPLRWTLEAAAPIVGAGRAPGGGSLARLLGLPPPRAFAILPMMHGDHLVAFAYVDHGGAPLPAAALSHYLSSTATLPVSRRGSGWQPGGPRRRCVQERRRRMPPLPLPCQRRHPTPPPDTEAEPTAVTPQVSGTAENSAAVSGTVAAESVSGTSPGTATAKVSGTVACTAAHEVSGTSSASATPPVSGTAAASGDDARLAPVVSGTLRGACLGVGPPSTFDLAMAELRGLGQPSAPAPAPAADATEPLPNAVLLQRLTTLADKAAAKSAAATPAPHPYAVAAPRRQLGAGLAKGLAQMHTRARATALLALRTLLQHVVWAAARLAYKALRLLLRSLWHHTRQLVAQCAVVAGLLLLPLLAQLRPPAWPPGAPPTMTVQVPPRTSLRGVAVRLGQANLVRSPRLFVALARLTQVDKAVRAGIYELPTNLWPWEVARHLRQGHVLTTRLTFPEGLTLAQCATLVENYGLHSRRAFLAAAKNPELLSRYGIDGETAEGFLYPDTYTVVRGNAPEVLVDTMLQRFFTQLRSLPEAAEQSSQMLYDRVILASLLEREAHDPTELRRIAGVFVNRLEQDMRLESCATVQYVLPAPKARLDSHDLDIESPYNTYLHAGLPPSPIANPGLPALRAAFAPEEHDHLFFVARGDGTGRHTFSKTYAEHQKAQKWAQKRAHPALPSP